MSSQGARAQRDAFTMFVRSNQQSKAPRDHKYIQMTKVQNFMLCLCSPAGGAKYPAQNFPSASLLCPSPALLMSILLNIEVMF